GQGTARTAAGFGGEVTQSACRGDLRHPGAARRSEAVFPVSLADGGPQGGRWAAVTGSEGAVQGAGGGVREVREGVGAATRCRPGEGESDGEEPERPRPDRPAGRFTPEITGREQPRNTRNTRKKREKEKRGFIYQDHEPPTPLTLCYSLLSFFRV